MSGHRDGLLTALDVLSDLPVALRFVRAVRGKSFRDVMDESGVHFNTVARTEGGHMPNMEHAIALSRWVASQPAPAFMTTEEGAKP